MKKKQNELVGMGFTLDSACSVWALVSVSVGGLWFWGLGPLGLGSGWTVRTGVVWQSPFFVWALTGPGGQLVFVVFIGVGSLHRFSGWFEFYWVWRSPEFLGVDRLP